MESDRQADTSALSTEETEVSSSAASVVAPSAKKPKAAPKSLARVMKVVTSRAPVTAGPAASDVNPRGGGLGSERSR